MMMYPVCSCKRQKTLTPEDFVSQVLQNTDQEEAVYKRFSEMMTWGLSKVWCAAFNKDDVANPAPTADTDELNMSLQAMSLYEDENDAFDALEQQIDHAPVELESLTDISSIEDDEEDHIDISLSNSSSGNLSSDDEFERHDHLQRIEDYLVDDIPCLTVTDSSEDEQTDQIAENFPFQIFQPPPYIEKHPPPSTGRDDDISILKEILDDLAFKTGQCSIEHEDQERILLAPDHKIGNNLLKLIQKSKKYRLFLPEFPLLHLRKSKIINLCSAYKTAGLVQMLMYMHDDETSTDWLKLISIQNIEAATRNIKRLSMAFHVTMMMLYLESLSEADQCHLEEQLKNVSSRNPDLEQRYESFISQQSARNVTFALHVDMMKHCDEIVAIYISERIGGKDGYQLLLSAVKSSLPFAFLNGASSYAAFCTKLLSEHYAAGPFWQAMKMSMFTSRHKNSKVNIALDTQREMDHRDVLRGFRPRASLSSVLPRMSLVDAFESAHVTRSSMFEKTNTETASTQGETDIFTFTNKDICHIMPTARMMLGRLRAILEMEDHGSPRNIYSPKQEMLTPSILDQHTLQLGHLLMYRFAVREGMFGLSMDDVPAPSLEAPKELIQKIKKAKSTTVQRTTCQPKLCPSSKHTKEKQRQTKVKKMKKSLDCMFSEMNTCQAILKPDCRKADVPKSSGIKAAMLFLIQECLPITQSIEDAMILHESIVPEEVSSSVKLIVMEFAGVKFKIPERNVKYLEFVERIVLGKLRHSFPSANHIVICEEKYKYTPDDLKAATREKRKSSDKTISHLKPTTDILTSDVLNRKVVTTSLQGKQAISIYLAHKIENLKLTDIILDIDSECQINDCTCGSPKACDCPSYAVPIRAVYGPDGLEQKKLLSHIHQRKGEAEMSQVDWLIGLSDTLAPGQSVLSVVTSGDIDALVIHLFVISRLWPRTDDGDFKNNVYLLLQKPNQKHDMYCITRLIQLLEKKFGNNICPRVAIALCIGGNDFIPKFAGLSHSTVLKAFLTENKIDTLVHFEQLAEGIRGVVDEETFLKGVKSLYCPKMYAPDQLTLEAVRQLSIKNPTKNEFNCPDKWMPPMSVLQKLLRLLHCQLDYLLTAGYHDATLPDFKSYGCLKRDEEGNVMYDLGDEVRIQNREALLTIPEKELEMHLKSARVQKKKRRSTSETPQKGQRRKRRVQASTPRKTSDQQ